MQTSPPVWLALIFALSQSAAGCTSSAPAVQDGDQTADTQRAEDVAVATDAATDNLLDVGTLEDVVSDIVDDAADAPDNSGGLDTFQIGNGCEDVEPTDLCSPSCSSQECGYGNCGTDCGACPEGTLCQPLAGVATACKPVDPGSACTSEADRKLLEGANILKAAAYCHRSCTGVACASTCVATATGLSEVCSACVADYGRCADGRCNRCEPSDWYSGCAATACGAAFFSCAGLVFTQ